MESYEMEAVKKNLTCDFLVKRKVIKSTLIETLVPTLYLEVNNKFVYLSELGTNNFKLFPYLNEKEKALEMGLYKKDETEDTLKNLIEFKNEIYKILKLDDYYQMVYLQIAI